MIDIDGTNYLSLDFKDMTNIKLVIGNGFDLACGLNSSYGNFFDSFKDLYEQIQNWNNDSDTFPYVIRIYNNEETKFIVSIWDFVFYSLKESKSSYNNPYILDWKNVEEVIKIALGCNKDKYGKVITEPLSFSFEDIFNNLNNIHDIKDSYAKKIANAIKYKRNSFDTKQEFYSFLLDELVLFEYRFSESIKNQMTPKYHQNAKMILFNYLKQSRHKLRSIDTFNYTTPNIFDEINQLDPYGSKRERVYVKHINGTLDGAIFGIDSNNINLDDPRYIFTKTYRKMIQLIKGHREDNEREFENVIIFGHSLSEADYSYFYSIMDNLDLESFSKKNSRIIFVFNDYDKNNHDINQIKLAKSVLKLIDSYDKWKNPNSNRFGLIEVLETSDRMGFAKIDTSELLN